MVSPRVSTRLENQLDSCGHFKVKGGFSSETTRPGVFFSDRWRILKPGWILRLRGMDSQMIHLCCEASFYGFLNTLKLQRAEIMVDDNVQERIVLTCSKRFLLNSVLRNILFSAKLE